MQIIAEAESLSLCQCIADDFIKHFPHEKTMPRLSDI